MCLFVDRSRCARSKISRLTIVGAVIPKGWEPAYTGLARIAEMMATPHFFPPLGAGTPISSRVMAPIPIRRSVYSENIRRTTSAGSYAPEILGELWSLARVPGALGRA